MQSPTTVDEFVNQVTELAKQVLLESKALAEVVTAEDAEERFPEHARQAATATSRLIEVVNAANIDFSQQQEELLQATREARDCLLELCRATKAAISNPYDFLTTQKLQNCLSGDTPVTLASGISMKIKDLAEAGLPEVLTLLANGTFVPARPSAHLVQGRRECIELLFSDGRKLVCTPDHKIRTRDGWCRAEALIAGESRVLLGVEAPLYDPSDDAPSHLAAFKLTLDNEEPLQMSNPQGVARAHALARLLGHLYTDGSVSVCERDNVFIGRLHLSHRIDADQAVKDAMLVVGQCGKPYGTHNYYEVLLPSHFLHALHNHPKIRLPFGKRKYLDYSLPELVMDPTCPKSFVREFLGALFGGDGQAPLPSTNKTFHAVAFSISKDAALSDSIDKFHRQIVTLLARFDITQVNIDSELDVTGNHTDSKPKPGRTMLSRVLRLSAHETLKFQEHVGFRYCAHKQQRLAVAAAFFRTDAYSRKQAQEFLKRVDELTGYSAEKTLGKGKRPSLKMSIPMAYKTATDGIPNSELFLNKAVAIPSLAQVQHALAGTMKSEGIGARSGRIKPHDFIASVGATGFFSDTPGALAEANGCPNKQARTESVNSPNRKVRWGIGCKLDGFPTWTATFVGSKPVGIQDVYDISVPESENFLAMGICVHNCRKGIALAIKQVLEISELIKEPPGDTVEKTIEEARSAVQAIGKMVVAARSQNSETFIETAKGAAASMSKMIEVAKTRNLDHDALFNSTQSIIKAAKATYKDNSKANQDELETSMKLIAEDIKQFVSALQNAPASAAPPAQKVITPLPPVTLDASMAPGKAVPPPSQTLPPPMATTASRSSATPPTNPPPAKLPPPNVMVTPASPGPAAPAASAAAGAKSDTAHAYVFSILQRFVEDSRSFRDEWNAQSNAAQEAWVRKLDIMPLDQVNVNIRDKLQALRSIAGALKPVSKEDALAQSELDNIRNLKDFAEWKKSTMGYSLRKRFASTVDALSKAAVSEISSLPKDNIVPQLLDSAAALGECVLDFIIKSFIVLPDDQNSSADFEAVTRELHDHLRRIVLISKASLGTQHVLLEKLLTSVSAAIDSNPSKGVADEGVRAVATTLLAQLVTATTKKRLFRDANSVRVLTIHMLCTINAASTNKSSLHYLFACQLGIIARAVMEALARLLNTHETLRFLAANRNNKVHDLSDVDLAAEEAPSKGGKKNKINAQLSSLIETEKSIWDEAEVPTKELQKGITTGSLNKLVLSISAENAYDNKLLKTFITTYRSFAAPYKLFQKLIERYNVPQGRGVDAKKIQTKVTIILKYWVENQFFDFDESLVQNLFDFIENVLPKDGWGDIAQILKKILKAQMEARNESLGSVPPTDLTIPESKMSPTELFMALNDEEIARQLTLIEFSIYKQIEPSELLNQSWNKDKLKYRAPNVIESLSRLNRLSFWVPSVILWQERMKERSKAYKKFVAIAEHLRRMNNYHTLMGIVAGLNMSSINRLKHTLNDVGPAVQNQFKELVKLMHPQGSFKTYRQALHKSKAPAIPYLGTYLTDLTFIEDGNPDNIDGQINFKKREMIHGTIQEIQLYQTTLYPFPPVEPIYTFLTDLPFCGEKELFDVSLILEPRDAELNQIIQ